MAEEEISAEKIKEAIDKEASSICKFGQDISNKTAIICLGNTKSGKSTVVNLFIRTKLAAYEHEDGFYYKYKKQDPRSEGPIIGDSKMACTTIPTFYTINNETGLIIIDMPGLGDNRGLLQDLINLLYINQIKGCKNVSFLLVVDINDIIHDSVNNFRSFMNNLAELLPNWCDIKNTFHLIFTKVPNTCGCDNICDILKTIIVTSNEENQTIAISGKELIEHIVNEKLVGIFKAPSEEGILNEDFCSHLGINISNGNYTETKLFKVNIAVSSETKAKLLEMYKFCGNAEDLEIKLRQHITKQIEVYNDNYIQASLNDELQKLKETLLKHNKLIAIAINSIETKSFKNNESCLEAIFNDSIQNMNADLKFLACIENTNLISDKNVNLIENKYKSILETVKENNNTVLKKIEEETEYRLNETKMLKQTDKEETQDIKITYTRICSLLEIRFTFETIMPVNNMSLDILIGLCENLIRHLQNETGLPVNEVDDLIVNLFSSMDITIECKHRWVKLFQNINSMMDMTHTSEVCSGSMVFAQVVKQEMSAVAKAVGVGATVVVNVAKIYSQKNIDEHKKELTDIKLGIISLFNPFTERQDSRYERRQNVNSCLEKRNTKRELQNRIGNITFN